MKSRIRQALIEELNLATFRVPKQVDVSTEEIGALRNVQWQDLQIEDLGGQGNIAYLKVNFPFETNASDGIVVDIQVIGGQVYQIHIHMSDNLQRMGLGYKIYKKLISEFGHLYSGKGRRMNPNVDKIWDRLKQDNDYVCMSNDNGDLCMTKDHPEPESLINFIR